MNQKWKKQHYRKIPDVILTKLASLGDSVVVAAVKKIPASDVGNGVYEHLGLGIEPDGTLRLSQRILPPPEGGRYSRWNLAGREIVRRDLPKIDRTFSFEVPNFGDWTKGTHDVYQIRKCYPRDIVEPKQLEISTTLLDSEAIAEPQYVLRFRVEEHLDVKAPGFNEALLFNINLLQENVGAAGVYRANAVDAEYTRLISIDWEILPEGTRDDVLPKLIGKVGGGSAEKTAHKLTERYQFLRQFRPVAWISGSSGFQRYFGAQFHEHLVAFENLDYGNAIYVMYEDWKRLSRLNRLELLAGQRTGYKRIIHRHGWQDQLGSAIREGLERLAA